MSYLFNIILKFIDFFYQKKIITFFKKKSNLEYNVIIDVGAHKGETILNFLKNFKIKNIYSFEASSKTYKYLDINVKKIRKKYNKTNIEIFNTGVGNSSEQKIFNDISSLIITWRVKQSKERFYVIDLLVADISLVVTKRSEFNSMLKNVNYNLKELNVLLEKQNNESYIKLIDF